MCSCHAHWSSSLASGRRAAMAPATHVQVIQLSSVTSWYELFVPYSTMAVCQNLVPLVNIKIAGKWMFIPLKMVLIGIDPYPYRYWIYPTITVISLISCVNHSADPIFWDKHFFGSSTRLWKLSRFDLQRVYLWFLQARPSQLSLPAPWICWPLLCEIQQILNHKNVQIQTPHQNGPTQLSCTNVLRSFSTKGRMLCSSR